MAKQKRRKRKRNCGSCQGCCEAVAVHELGKPKETKCAHQCQMGCAIYDQRPNDCKIYSCAYLDSQFKNEELRPDRCGFIAEVCRWQQFAIAFTYESKLGSGAIEKHHDALLDELKPGFMILRTDTGELLTHEADVDAAEGFRAILESGQMELHAADGVTMQIPGVQ